MKLSSIAEAIRTPPILRVATEINEKIARGEKFFNFTIGDFDPSIFPIPDALTDAIVGAYADHQTNYPGVPGVLPLREGIQGLLSRFAGVHYATSEIQVACGSRPLIYAMYRSVVDPGDRVVFPAPSWMNDEYSRLCGAQPVSVPTSSDDRFLPTAESLEEHLRGASLLALCSPQNPTGTVFAADQLKDICELVVAENRRRGKNEKPLYVMFDKVYWLLTFAGVDYAHPLNLCPEIRDYALFVDGMSKAFAGTGIRVGWGYGPSHLVRPISDLLAYFGAWAPRPEQVASARYLADLDGVNDYLVSFRDSLYCRLKAIHEGFGEMKARGLDVDSVAPQAGIYLTVKINMLGRTTPSGVLLETADQALRYLLDEARVGVLPFSFFGAADKGHWYRISVGTCRIGEIPELLDSLEQSLLRLR